MDEEYAFLLAAGQLPFSCWQWRLGWESGGHFFTLEKLCREVSEQCVGSRNVLTPILHSELAQFSSAAL